MPNYSPSLPLTLSPRDGTYENLQDLIAVTAQNLKMILLTAPGERVMDPEFGVGMRNYLFEQNNISTYTSIRSNINRQVKKYLPFVDIQDVDFNTEDTDSDIQANRVNITVRFYIRPLNSSQQLTINL
jgi:phage baseplate assembly protein W